MDKIEQLQQMINESQNIVFFGGAGVSTESNIPDFRSADGLFRENYSYPPERIVSHTFFVQKPEFFYQFYFNIYNINLNNEFHDFENHHKILINIRDFCFL